MQIKEYSGLEDFDIIINSEGKNGIDLKHKYTGKVAKIRVKNSEDLGGFPEILVYLEEELLYNAPYGNAYQKASGFLSIVNMIKRQITKKSPFLGDFKILQLTLEEKIDLVDNTMTHEAIKNSVKELMRQVIKIQEYHLDKCDYKELEYRIYLVQEELYVDYFNNLSDLSKVLIDLLELIETEE